MNLYQSHIAERISCRVICICVGLLALSALPSSAQVNGTGPSDSSLFTTVVNLPEDLTFLPAFDPIINGASGQTTQVNLGSGGVVDFFARTGSGIELNVNGGTVGALFTVGSGSELNLNSGTIDIFGLEGDGQVNINGGSLTSILLADAGSQVNINGGDFDSYVDQGPAELNITDGNIGVGFGSMLTSSAGSTWNISGGTFTSLLFGIAGTANISGGTLSGIEDFNLSDGGEINLVGSDFFLDGIALNDLTPGAPILISDRDVILSGLLSDGSRFDFDLSTDEFAPQFFSPNATLTVSLTPASIPEPTSSMIFSLAALVALCVRRRN